MPRRPQGECTQYKLAPQWYVYTVCAGSRLLHRSLAEARTDPNILSAYLHVHVANEEAIRFYLNNGFTLGPVIRRYYKRIEPPDAVTLSKQLW